MYILEFANEGEDFKCHECGAVYTHWTEGAKIADLIAIAQAQNNAWEIDGSPRLDYRIISVVAKVST